MHLCRFSLITSEIIRLTYQCRYQFVEDVMRDILSTKEVLKSATLQIPKGIKNAVFIPIPFRVDILIRNENIVSKEYKTKKDLK